MDHHPNKRPAKQSRASLIVLITLAFLLMITAIIMAISLPEDDYWQSQATSTTINSPELSGFACQPTEAQQMYPFAGGVMKLTTNRIALLDIRGTEQFSADVDFNTPFSIVHGDLFLAGDRDGYSFTLFDSKGLHYEAVVEGRISGAAIRDDGHVAIVQDRIGSTGMVTLFAPITGKKMFDVIFAESGYVLSVSFPPDDDSFDVALINTDYSEARPVVKRYSLEGRQLGQRLPDLNQIFPLIVYDADSDLVICGADSLAAIDYARDELVWTRRFQQVVAIRSTTVGLVVLASDRQDELIGLHLLRKDGSSAFDVTIGDSITNLDIRQHLAAMGSGTRAQVVNLKSGEIILDYDAAAEIVRVGFAGDDALTLVTRSGVMRVAFP